MKLKQMNVEVQTGIHVTGIVRKKSGFNIHFCPQKDKPQMLKADRIILTTGGKAAPVLGSDGSGYDLAKSLGHSVSPVVPALVQLRVKHHPLSKAAGVRTEGKIRIFENNKIMGEDTGELQITAYGISGIPVFQISRHASKSLYYKKHVRAEIDFLPEMSEKDVTVLLQQRKKEKNTLDVTGFLVGIFNQKLIPCLLRCAGIANHLPVSSLSNSMIRSFSQTCKHFPLEIEASNGFENAQVCAGGIRLTEISPDTMESLCCKGLYLAGEILDVDGICGGYNLQWAWASGYIAGESAGK